MRSSQVLENYLTSSAGRGRLSKAWKLPQTEEILLMELLGGKKLCLLTWKSTQNFILVGKALRICWEKRPVDKLTEEGVKDRLLNIGQERVIPSFLNLF